jgi:hypothetical protein
MAKFYRRRTTKLKYKYQHFLYCRPVEQAASFIVGNGGLGVGSPVVRSGTAMNGAAIRASASANAEFNESGRYCFTR